MSEQAPEQRKFTVLDIDGTLLRWQLYHALADEMVHGGMIDPEEFEAVREARMTWKQRANENSFQTYERALVQLVDKSLPGVKLADFNDACDRVMDQYKDQVYTYTRNLVRAKKAENSLLFAISASQVQIVGKFATYYGFDDYAGSEYEVIDGVFTGVKSLLVKSDMKREVLGKMVEKHNATWTGSVAVGDSESDIPMLAAVERPIAFNPSSELADHAKKHHWDIVVERKNMVFPLVYADGKYQWQEP
jgi:HAD superfamily hydrolase (TIGR01490 family)